MTGRVRSVGARASESLDDVASVVEKLAVLLSAGVPPAAAWGYLAESSTGEQPVVSLVAKDVAGGMHIAEAILHAVSDEVPGARLAAARGDARKAAREATAAWRGLAAAWIVATEAGAPLAQALREFSFSLRALAQAKRAAATALAGPVATAKLVVVLPLVGVLFGVALGFDTIGTLVSTPPGLVCLVVGCVLLWLARVWNRHLVRVASPTDLTPGLALDLLAVAVSGGASIEKARATVARAFEQGRCTTLSSDTLEADAVFELSQRAGVPAGTLLRSEADRIRREASSEAERKAETLAVTLMLPLGLCVLPAFMLLGVAPLMISVLSSTVGGL